MFWRLERERAMRPFVFALGAVAAVACSSGGERATQTDIPRIASPSEALKPHMRAHFAAASAIQRATVSGQLEQAKQEATWLLAHDEPSQLASWTPYVDEMKSSARAILDAPDLTSAAVGVSQLGRVCSRCHQATNAVVSFAWEESPPDSPLLAVQMSRHEWAAARLWEGLVAPSNDVWREGAAVMASSRLDVLATSSGTSPSAVLTFSERVHELATSGGTIDEPEARATLYGKLLTTCVACHALVRPPPRN
jgi:hypothetical protein